MIFFCTRICCNCSMSVKRPSAVHACMSVRLMDFCTIYVCLCVCVVYASFVTLHDVTGCVFVSSFHCYRYRKRPSVSIKLDFCIALIMLLSVQLSSAQPELAAERQELQQKKTEKNIENEAKIENVSRLISIFSRTTATMTETTSIWTMQLIISNSNSIYPQMQ